MLYPRNTNSNPLGAKPFCDVLKIDLPRGVHQGPSFEFCTLEVLAAKARAQFLILDDLRSIVILHSKRLFIHFCTDWLSRLGLGNQVGSTAHHL